VRAASSAWSPTTPALGSKPITSPRSLSNRHRCTTRSPPLISRQVQVVKVCATPNAEILDRYPIDDPVHRTWRLAGPIVAESVTRTQVRAATASNRHLAE
jgi:hypothetical protein